MASSAWKGAERETAKAIGGVRLLFAEAGGDAESARFVADAKRVKSYSLNQARKDPRQARRGQWSAHVS